MNPARKVEVFSAGCSCCYDAVRLVQSIVGSTGEMEILDMYKPDVSAKAKELGIVCVPAIVVDGKLAECCAVSGLDEQKVQVAGIGAPQ